MQFLYADGTERTHDTESLRAGCDPREARWPDTALDQAQRRGSKCVTTAGERLQLPASVELEVNETENRLSGDTAPAAATSGHARDRRKRFRVPLSSTSAIALKVQTATGDYCRGVGAPRWWLARFARRQVH